MPLTAMGGCAIWEPRVGGMIAVAEACRNVSCVGGEPIALTDCLNFGNPEKAETYYQLEECVKGMVEASRALGAPVISGNVSLYNETQGRGIYPTPIIGCLGLLDDVRANVGIGFARAGDVVALLGVDAVGADPADLAGSEYLEAAHGLVAGMPALDLAAEVALQRACRRLVREGVIRSAHDCSEGGLAVALAECCIVGGMGAVCGEGEYAGAFGGVGERWDAALFGERQSRVVVSLDAGNLGALEAVCDEEGVPYARLGWVSDGKALVVGDLLNVSVADMADVWGNGLERAARGVKSGDATFEKVGKTFWVAGVLEWV